MPILGASICNTCQWFYPKDAPYGECRRYAPKEVDQWNNFTPKWPRVNGDHADVCGDYNPQPKTFMP